MRYTAAWGFGLLFFLAWCGFLGAYFSTPSHADMFTKCQSCIRGDDEVWADAVNNSLRSPLGYNAGVESAITNADRVLAAYRERFRKKGGE